MEKWAPPTASLYFRGPVPCPLHKDFAAFSQIYLSKFRANDRQPERTENPWDFYRIGYSMAIPGDFSLTMASQQFSEKRCYSANDRCSPHGGKV